MNTTHFPITEEILDLFRLRGDSEYGGEAVTQLEHALQAATFAEREGAESALVAAALIHDVGHLLHDLLSDAPDLGIDDRHETLAAAWLAKRFPPNVVAPVAMHVAAKRYLCAVDPVLPQLNLEFSVAGVSITPKAGELDECVSEWLTAA